MLTREKEAFDQITNILGASLGKKPGLVSSLLEARARASRIRISNIVNRTCRIILTERALLL